MTATPTPTWYDVLGVSRGASPEEIKAAWRSATDKFEPGSGSGQFRMFSEAADVLLDPERRAAYDASLDAESTEAAEATGTPEGTGTPERDEGEAGSADAQPEAAQQPRSGWFRRWSRRRTERRRARAEARADAADQPGVTEPASRRALLLTAVLAVLTVLALVVAGWFGLQVRRDARVADARQEAPAAAEQAAKALFSYDYRHLPADRKRAATFVTDSFGKKYLKNFTQLEKQADGSPGLAVQSKAVVKASVVGSGVVDAEDGVVRVLVYVNQVSEKPKVDTQIFQNRVTMTMRKDGNRWLVDAVKSY